MFHTPITSALASSRGIAELPNTLLISPLLSSLPTYLEKVLRKKITFLLLWPKTPGDLVVEDVEEEGIVAEHGKLLLLHDLDSHWSKDCVVLGKDDISHNNFS